MEINKFIVQAFDQTLYRLHGRDKVNITIDKSHNALISNNLFEIKYFVNEDYRKVYLDYSVGKVSANLLGITLIQNMINQQIREDGMKDTHYKFEILNDSTNNIVRESYNYIRANCFTMWKSARGTYKFIEDSIMLKQDHDPRCNLNMTESEWFDRENKFIKELGKINAKYNFNGMMDIATKAFNEYQKLYKDTYNRQLIAVGNNYESITLKVDIINRD